MEPRTLIARFLEVELCIRALYFDVAGLRGLRCAVVRALALPLKVVQRDAAEAVHVDALPQAARPLVGLWEHLGMKVDVGEAKRTLHMAFALLTTGSRVHQCSNKFRQHISLGRTYCCTPRARPCYRTEREMTSRCPPRHVVSTVATRECLYLLHAVPHVAADRQQVVLPDKGVEGRLRWHFKRGEGYLHNQKGIYDESIAYQKTSSCAQQTHGSQSGLCHNGEAQPGTSLLQ